MVKVYVAGVLGLAGVVLGGCQTVFDSVGVAVPLSAGEAHHYNGSYQGTVDTITATNTACRPSEPERVLIVGDGALTYAYSPATVFVLPVGYDGGLDGRSGEATLHGRIVGDHLQATVKSGPCVAEISMDYILNHS